MAHVVAIDCATHSIQLLFANLDGQGDFRDVVGTRELVGSVVA